MGARVRIAREARKMTQEQLGAAVGIGKGMISAIERGRFMPSVVVLRGLGRTLHTGVDALLEPMPARTPQGQLPGMSVAERIDALPEAMREFVLVALARAEGAVKHVPSQFLRPTTSEDWPAFAAYLEALTRKEKLK